ncbi:hypothetical protein [Actinoplanes sp. GCM10030250]|uniref:hypothetical protein n=1 Tax=Actinoplanes sp. GCM10030250 TaxID=3273376 RepID=UPI00361A03B8
MDTSWIGDGRISGAADGRAALDRVNATAQTRGATALLTRPVQTAAEAALTAPDASRAVPTHPDLNQLMPWPGGIRRGATVAAVGSTSLIMVLLAGALKDTGAYAAVVGMPAFGALCASVDHSIPLGHLALVPEPGPDWPTVVATLLDGVDIVVVQPPVGTAAAIIRSLQARARQRGTVLVSTQVWTGADLTLQVTGRRWHGLGRGRGRLKWQELDVQTSGRGSAARPRSTTLTLHYRPPVIVPPPARRLAPSSTLPEPLANGHWGNLETRPASSPWAALNDRAT